MSTWDRVAYLCFIIDAFSRMIVGGRVAGHMRIEMVLDALEMAPWRRGHLARRALVCHSDAGSQFTSTGTANVSTRSEPPLDRQRGRLL